MKGKQMGGDKREARDREGKRNGAKEKRKEKYRSDNEEQ